MPPDVSPPAEARLTPPVALGPGGLVPRFLGLAAAPFRGATRTVPRRRMTVLAATGLLFGLFTAGLDVALPLWVSRDLHLTPADWSMLWSLRMTGILVGVIFLGAVSDRLGQKSTTAAAMAGTAGVLAALAWGPGRWIWWLMPVLGGLVSTCFVNLNTLTQFVSDRRQGLANTIYRGVGAAAGIVAPFAVTSLAMRWGGYPPVFVVLMGLLLVAAVTLSRYPEVGKAAPLGGLRDEVRGMLRTYGESLRHGPLMRFIGLYMLWGSLLTSVVTYAALRFTLDLGVTQKFFGFLGGVAAGATLLATLVGGFVLDRLPLRWLMACVGTAAAGGAAMMGVGDSVAVTAVGFVIATSLTGLLVSPASMWISRAAAAGRQNAAFAVGKIVMAAYYALSAAVMSALVPRLGMGRILLSCGVLGLCVSATFLLLTEPPPPGGRRASEG